MSVRTNALLDDAPAEELRFVVDEWTQIVKAHPPRLAFSGVIRGHHVDQGCLLRFSDDGAVLESVAEADGQAVDL